MATSNSSSPNKKPIPVGCEGVRFRKRDYFGVPVDLQVKQMESMGKQNGYTFKMAMKRGQTGKNPLLTGFTVKNLKKLLEQQEAKEKEDK